MVHRFVALAISTSMIVVLSACAPTAQPPTPTPAPQATSKPAAATPTMAAAKPVAKPLEKIKMQIPNRSAGYLELYLGKEKGIFAEEGLDPDIVALQANLSVPALLNGDVDYAIAGAGAFEAVIKGEPIRVVMLRKVNNAWHIFLAPGIASAKDIEGKSLALQSREGLNSFATQSGLKTLGVDPSKVAYVVANNTEMLAALKSGAVAAASITSPEGYMAAAMGFKEVLDTRDILSSPSGLTATAKKIQENPDQVKRLIRANLKSIAYMKDHKEEAVQWLMSQFSLEKTVAEKVLDEEIAFRTIDGSITDQALTNLTQIVRLDTGFENTTVDQIKRATDTTLLLQVQKEMGLTK